MKKWYFRERNYRTLRESVIPTKKSTLKGAYHKWCAIVCDYRTNFYDDYKQLGYKLELLLDQIEDTNADNMQLLSA